MIHLIYPDQLYKLIKQNKVVVIDVRPVSEHTEGVIDVAKSVPLDVLSLEEIKKLNPEGKMIVFHCRSGGRSLKACQMIQEQDKKLELGNLEGGIIAWKHFTKEQNNDDSLVGGSCAL